MITNKTIRILHIDLNHKLLVEKLSNLGFINEEDYNSSKEEIEKKIHQYHGIVIRSRFKIDSSFLKKAVNLKFIARVGAGLENIDCEYAFKNGIHLISAPEGNKNAVGEHTLAMILSLFNKLNKANKEVKSGQWLRENNRGIELDGKTIGIIGYGNMGKAFAKKLKGFDVETLCYDIKPNVEDANCKQVSLKELQQKIDVLSLHTPQNNLTINMVNKTFIDAFNKPFWFINTARGKSVVTKDLVYALRTGKILGAGLDVLEYEKTSFENLFRAKEKTPDAFKYLITAKNVILTPHIAGWTIESKQKLAQTIVDKIETFFDKKLRPIMIAENSNNTEKSKTKKEEQNSRFTKNISEKAEKLTDVAEEKLNDFANEAKAKLDEALNSETAKNLKNKAEELVDDVKTKFDEAQKSETAKNIKEKASEFANQAEDVLESIGKKAGKYAKLAEGKIENAIEHSPEGIQKVVQKGKDLFKRLFSK